jgi:DNA-binding beta-propeller fold protein YncE
MTLVHPARSFVLAAAFGAALGACSDPVANGVIVELSPEVISSIDGTTTVEMLVIEDRTPLAGQAVRISVAYTDRNGVDHAIDGVEGETDSRGAFSAVLTGLAWEGTGTVTAEVIDVPDVSATATFAVLDRTPPVVEILPPTDDLHVGPGLPLEVEVRVQDEIGVAEVWFEAAGEVDRNRSTVIASGSTDATVPFRMDVPGDALAGPTITLYAMASDLSGNLAAAEPIVLTVDPAIAIATPPQLEGDLLVDGTDQFLVNPRSLAVSPMDGMIYVADNAGTAPCNGACIRQVDPADGSVASGAVFVGQGDMEGVAFDASGDHLYYTDRQNRVGQLTWNTTTSRYENQAFCNVPANQDPVEPYHLVHDATLGGLIVDDESQSVRQQLACTGTDPTEFTAQNFDTPRGIALGAGGEIYVSDINDDAVYIVDRTDGSFDRFEDDNLDEPYGLEWLDGGASVYADTLMIANRGDRTVESSAGNGTRPTAYLRNDPIDVAIDGGTMYVLTTPSAGDRGRIFSVTGF